MVRWAFLVFLLAGLVFSARERPSPATDLPVPSTAELCGECHREIQEGWKRSAHAVAMESRLFQDALRLAEEELGAASRRVCLSCHAPLAVEVGDLALIRKTSWEGVTCDYCHSIREVSVASANPRARVELSQVKSGPSKESVSPVHGTAYSNVHTTALACAPCHEYTNSLGFPVLTTYTEWKESSYGKNGGDCQSCHMYMVEGDIVDPRVRRSSQSTINLHEMPGGRSVDQLNKAVGSQLTASREGNTLNVAVRMANQGAGHYVPTGSPLRQMILEVRVELTGGKSLVEERHYRRTVVDRNGKEVTGEHLAFMRGAKQVQDTRLAPGETRIEKFSFPLSQGQQARVVANLYYYYSPNASAAQQKKRFLTHTRWVR